MNFFKRRPARTIRPVNRAIASRAIYAEARGYLPTVQMTFELTSGEQITFELQVDEAGKFIEQATAAYRAIVPTLRTGGAGWGG